MIQQLEKKPQHFEKTAGFAHSDYRVLFPKSPKTFEIGRGFGPDFGHINFTITLRCTKTKSVVLGLNINKLRKMGRGIFLYRNGNPVLKFALFLYYTNILIHSHHFGYA